MGMVRVLFFFLVEVEVHLPVLSAKIINAVNVHLFVLVLILRTRTKTTPQAARRKLELEIPMGNEPEPNADAGHHRGSAHHPNADTAPCQQAPCFIHHPLFTVPM